ncbi:MAG TPA: ATP-binding protein [Deltaproteobacteria bacterium]|nr:ATP-binding protein [Deltaproteobacteria bacterium]
MAGSRTPHMQAPELSIEELTLLYQLSNTLLSTIRLNKLTHLILTALTNHANPLFERAMLFLYNDKTGTLQGMLGVTTDPDNGLFQIGNGDSPLARRWDILGSVIDKQRTSPLSQRVRHIRISTEDRCPLIKRVVIDRQATIVEQDADSSPTICQSLNELGATAYVAIPLLSEDKLTGVVVVDNPNSRRPIQSARINFLTLFARQAGMAIENSMIYNRMEDAHFNLRDAKERLMHGERLAAIGEMAANLVHELKHPLVTIGGFAGRLVKTLPEGTRERQYAETIIDESVHLENMLSDILAFSRKPTICYSICDMAEIINSSLESSAPLHDEHAIRVIRNIDDAPAYVLGDAYQLKQAFLNLVINATEAMPNGGTLEITAYRSPVKEGMLIVSIEDTGGGIPLEMQSKLFSPFFTTKHRGTGLGLPIVNRIIQNHNGTITATNSSHGAVFTVSLPLTEPPQQQ